MKSLQTKQKLSCCTVLAQAFSWGRRVSLIFLNSPPIMDQVHVLIMAVNKISISCTISGGQDKDDIQHAVEVCGWQDNGYLSCLSQRLVTLRDTVNLCLSELVDKEKALVGNGHRRMDTSDSGMDYSTSSLAWQVLH